MIDSSFLKNNFISEARELLDKLESQLLELEKRPTDIDIIQEIFRITHTFKGSATMVGFDKIGKIAHHLESIYDSIRKGVLHASGEIITLTLKTTDVLSLLLEKNEELDNEEQSEFNKLYLEIESYSNSNSQDSIIENESEKSGLNNISEIEEKYFFIHFKPNKDIFIRGINPHYLFEDIGELGRYWSDPRFDRETQINQDDKKEFSEQWIIFLSTSKNREDIIDQFLFYQDDEYEIFQIDSENIHSDKEFIKYYSGIDQLKPDVNKISEILFGLKSDTTPENLNITDDDQGILANQIPAEVDNEDAMNEQVFTEKSVSVNSIESIRVPSYKLDELINLVSELVIINSQLSYQIEGTQSAQLKKTINTLEKLYKQLRNNALELRLVPIKKITLKFQRLVRDLSKKLNKKVEFITVGTDTELDSNIISKIESPLMHIIRNSLDHGIEDEETRINQSKSPTGIIRLISFYSGANVFIQVQDDGKGIDKEFIRKKAIEKGIINATDKLSDKEIYDIIFLPGFSTAQSLTDLSGRGVGMDVVKKNIQELRGTIEIDSEIGLGTSVTLKLPLTLSIIDTLQVNVNEKPYLIPLNIIDSCYKINHSELVNSSSKHIQFKDQILPYIYLREYFKLDGEVPEIEHLIILEYNEKKYGLIADKVIGEHQAVIKPLGPIHKNQEYITGAGILGDGSLAIILDANKLILSIKEEAIYE
ncbi:MAG: chemotaxis protein CheA [Bacteroidales bacterium]|nr:chemotaxis protein CheA [Bacteroidales bacterium]